MLLVKNEILVMTSGLVRQIMRSVQQAPHSQYIVCHRDQSYSAIIYRIPASLERVPCSLTQISKR